MELEDDNVKPTIAVCTPEASPTSTSSGSQCHSLPCKMEYSGRAPVEVFFAPHLIPTTDSTGDNHDNKDTSNMYAAHFRGRQLLATEPYQHARIAATKTEASPTTTKMQGRLLELHACHSSTSPEKIQVVAQFDGIWQWQHESEPRRAANAAATLAEKNRVVAAMQWCDVAHAVCTAGVVVDLYIYVGGKCSMLYCGIGSIQRFLSPLFSCPYQ